MDATSLSQLIANMGFPIACCIYLFYSNEKLRGILEENTAALVALKELLRKDTE